MRDDSRATERHATMSSLKATHTAHRVADDIYSHPTERLRAILNKKEQMYPSNVPVSDVIPEPDPEPEPPVVNSFIQLVVRLILICLALGLLFVIVFSLLTLDPPVSSTPR